MVAPSPCHEVRGTLGLQTKCLIPRLIILLFSLVWNIPWAVGLLPQAASLDFTPRLTIPSVSPVVSEDQNDLGYKQFHSPKGL